MIDELPVPKHLYCPKAENITISGDGITDNLNSLTLHIEPKNPDTILDEVVANTQVLTAGVFRYFNPEEYLEEGYQNAITLTEDIYTMSSDHLIDVYRWISTSYVQFYSFTFIDTTGIAFYDYSTQLTDYEPDGETSRNVVGKKAQFRQTYLLRRKQATYEWKVESLDILLGYIGGISSLVWATRAICMGGYENFKFENSLISSIYPTSPIDYELNKIPSTEPKAKKVLMTTVKERGKYFYSYAEYLFAKWCSWWCCCLKGHWLNRRVKKL